MYMKIRQNLVLCTCFLFLLGAKAQDAQFSQFYATPVFTNPAATGAALHDRFRVARFGLNFSKQQVGTETPRRLLAASWDQPIRGGHSGLGAVILDDIAYSGFVKNRTVAASYSFMFPLNRHRLFMRFGVQGSLSFRSLDLDRFVFDITPVSIFVPPGEAKVSKTIHYPNFNAGWLIYNSRFFAGIAAHNILTPNWSFYKGYKDVIQTRFSLHAGKEFPLSKCGKKAQCKNSIVPNLILMKQGETAQLNFGCNANLNHLILGTYFKQTFAQYNANDAVSLLLGFRKNRFQCGYSFDFPVSQGRSVTGVSHEISLNFNLCLPPGARSHRPLINPEF